jgi:hypothetical protein
MTVDVLGPACDLAVTVRPARTNTRGVNNTWFQDCTSPTADDGTEIPADYMNDVLAQLRTAFVSSGITLDNADDMLWRAIESVQSFYIIDTPITKTVHGSSPDFVDLHAAFEWVSKYVITQNGSVAFNVSAGQFVYTSAVLVDHPNADRITVNGAALIGAAPVASDFACTGYSSGARSADAATNLSMLRTKYATEIRFNGCGGIGPIAGASIADLLITSDGGGGAQSIGILAESSCLFSTCSVHGFASHGVLIYEGRFGAAGFTVSGCGNCGVAVQPGAIFTYSGVTVVSGNAAQGLNLTGAQVWQVGSGIIVVKGNGSNGATLQQGSGMLAPSSQFSTNDGDGVTLVQSVAYMPTTSFDHNFGWGINAIQSRVYCETSTFPTNGSGTLRAYNGSIIDALSAAVLGSESPAANTLGNNNSLIVA